MSTEDLRLAGLLKRALTRLLESYGPQAVDPRELAVLSLLGRRGPCSQQEISRRLGIDRTTMVALVDTLAGRELVRRRPDPADRRKNMVELTTAGETIGVRAGREVDAAEDRFLASLTAAERQNLLELLRKVVN